jgi:ABC-type lipoprotein export system ATPase subunit
MRQIVTEIVLQAEELTREYRVGGNIITALDHVDLQVIRGEFVAIMGPSGGGKSTLLNLLGGLDQPTAGRVMLETHDLAEFDEEQLAALRRAKMGFIFQRHDLFPVLTARENVEFPLLLNDVSPALRRTRAEELLALVGLAKVAEHLPDELSGGQQQRVGIARALANGPHVLLADEPTGNLDSLTANEVMQALIALAEERNLTLVLVTHDPETSMHADRILNLQDGRIVTGDEAIT